MMTEEEQNSDHNKRLWGEGGKEREGCRALRNRWMWMDVVHVCHVESVSKKGGDLIGARTLCQSSKTWTKERARAM